MRLEQSPCNDNRLEGYLSGALSVADRGAVEAHLDHCDACRSAMEQLAAAPAFWSAAANYLDTRRDTERETLAHKVTDSGCFASWSAAAGVARFDETIVGEDTEYIPFLRDWLAPVDPAAETEHVNEAILGRLGKYDVLSVISRGGMGLVLKAIDRDLDRYVAIKTLLGHLASSREAKQRFAREAQAVASMHHRHVIAIYSVESWREVPYIVMPYLEDGTLHRYAAQHKLQIVEILSVAKQIANGLAAAHECGLVHRDVKPSNVLLQRGLSEVVLSDFGLARDLEDQAKTQSMLLAGTPQFMSPEQVLGLDIDTRSDLFSFGSLLYWLCTGQSPFSSQSSYGTLNLIAQQKHRPVRQLAPEIPDWLERLIDRLLEKSPENRLQTAKELDQLLEGCLDHLRDPYKNALPNELYLPSSLKIFGSRFEVGRLTRKFAIFGGLVVALYAGLWLMPSEVMQQESDSSNIIAKQSLEDKFESNPPYANRRGPLDTLDVANMMHDLELQQHQLYWLRRLAALPVGELPASALPWVVKLSEGKDEQLQLLAHIILDKDPFEVVEDRK